MTTPKEQLFIKRTIFIALFCMITVYSSAFDWQKELQRYNPYWTVQSKNSGESMPCGGGDIGMNVWVENDEIFLYLSRSGVFEENNVFPKLGRVRLSFQPNIFKNAKFSQELKLYDGHIEIKALWGKEKASVEIWANVFTPVINIGVKSDQPVKMTATYENWRTEPLVWEEEGRIRASIAYRNAPVKAVIQPDSIQLVGDKVVWFHRNAKETLFDLTVKQQKLDSVKHLLWNPLKNLTFGGCMEGDNMIAKGTCQGKYIDTDFKGYQLISKVAKRKQQLQITLHTAQTATLDEWEQGLQKTREAFAAKAKQHKLMSRKWWNDYWKRSYVFIDTDSAAAHTPSWQVGRNYQLFRYQLGCNAYGKLPTKFNGGLFTYDPSLVDSKSKFTPDHRDWGGGTHTAQNQRLVYWPMLKSGDFDMLKPQLDFYLNALTNAEQRVKAYWGHEGACFTEQIEWFGLPMAGSYGWNRNALLHPGIQDNKWIDYEWDTVLEICKMALDANLYSNMDIKEYIPLVEKCLTFFDQHYQYLSAQRSCLPLDGNGKLVLYPSTGCETYKMAYNSANTIAALKSVTKGLLQLSSDYLTEEQRKHWTEFENRIPDIPFRECKGHRTIAPAVTWERINNIEIPQLYPVFPWGLYGLGMPDQETAVNTWKYGMDNENQRHYISWHQDAIFCARLGLTEEAKEITLKKMTDSPRRYPTFWGPGHDWVPDHNWGGSGMIGIQEMLMQAVGDRIYLLPSWPKEWNVSFKLHAPGNTTVECIYKDRRIHQLNVFPEERRKDIVTDIPTAEGKYISFIPGETCAIADMVQVMPTENVQKDSLWNIWCGSMVKGYDNRYHLYYSRWPRHTGHQSWISHSEVAYAVADKPEGPYRFVNIPLLKTTAPIWDGATTHNPYIITHNNKYYLYYVGTKGVPVDDDTIIPASASEWWKRRNSQRIGVAVADNPEGPWRRLPEPVLEASQDSTAFDAMCVSNPAVCVGRDNKIVMLYKAVCKNGTTKGGRVRFSVAFADSPEGPFVKTNKLIFQPDDPKANMVAEDPYVWYDYRTDRYYAIIRDVVDQFSGKDSGKLALLTSDDAVVWQAAKYPKVLPAKIKWTDGSVYDVRASTIERPCLYRDENGIPRFFFGAFGVHKGKIMREHSFNGRIPLMPVVAAEEKK